MSVSRCGQEMAKEEKKALSFFYFFISHQLSILDRNRGERLWGQMTIVHQVCSYQKWGTSLIFMGFFIPKQLEVEHDPLSAV